MMARWSSSSIDGEARRSSSMDSEAHQQQHGQQGGAAAWRVMRISSMDSKAEQQRMMPRRSSSIDGKA